MFTKHAPHTRRRGLIITHDVKHRWQILFSAHKQQSRYPQKHTGGRPLLCVQISSQYKLFKVLCIRLKMYYSPGLDTIKHFKILLSQLVKISLNILNMDDLFRTLSIE